MGATIGLRPRSVEKAINAAFVASCESGFDTNFLFKNLAEGVEDIMVIMY